ncbi:Arylsulfatase [Pontiella desulfatans]|uniref:Arylsulfatase n=1 Tax=Pontiella desulfatans TaxID=2750659 RepID=A0A6C2UBR5_PONDE|nr:sulfatase-like hydrolase/transferase [Pontiella desulfatans]SPS74095.1 sulfatase S1_23 [Kiritimatiellales bacterium]VGO17612.1 Arylsulfatase [Pontiella desulfatans]
MLRRCFLAAAAAVSVLGARAEADRQPNIILMMADDLGYGDTGFNGNTIIKTPNLDQMARDGVKLTHFYAGNSVCSPTRGTCLTGRHHHRFGIWTANAGHLPKQEITLASMLKSKGYTTGHFGKWHLGTLDKVVSSKGTGRKPVENFAPPWQRDYDRSFVTESAVNTWNPGSGNRSKNNPFYDDGKALAPDDPRLAGGAARVVVDQAVPFMEKAVAEGKPFLSVVWFHAPHEDIEAGPDYLDMYEGHGEGAHYYGCITELDEQVGRIRQTLEKLGVAENTLLFFCSDNGPEGAAPKGRRQGVTNGLRGRKRALYDGGVRVPALAAWPGKIQPGSVVGSPLSTLDYFPTVKNLVGYQMPDARPIDGQDILGILTGKTPERETGIPFVRGNEASLVKDGFKLKMPGSELYDLSKDWAEENNVAAAHPERMERMRKELDGMLASFRKSHAGADYNDPSYKPGDPWKGPGATTPKAGKKKNK